MPAVPLRKVIKNTPGRPRGRPPNINKHLLGSKPHKIKEHNFLTPSSPYSWQNLLYSQAMSANMDANTALNIMMSKYQEELLRQYSLGNSNPLLANPFAIKNPAVQSSTIQNTTTLTAVTKEVNKELHKEILPTSKPAAALETASKSIFEKKESTETKVRYSKELNKPYYAEQQKECGENLNLFKDRPGISITPVQNSSLQNSASIQVSKLPLSTSPNKTLQQKLAERQKQNPAAQQKGITKKGDTSGDIISQLQNLTQTGMAFSNQNASPIHNTPKTQNTSLRPLQKNLPSSLTITKSQPQNIVQDLHSSESNISISEIPSSSNFMSDMSTIMSFRKPPIPKIKQPVRKLGNEITMTPNYNKPVADPKIIFPPNIPLALNVTKKDSKADTKPKVDDIEIITIE